MNGIRDYFLACAALTGNQNRRRAGRDLLDHAHDVSHFGAGVDNASGAALVQLLAKLTIFTRQILLLGGLFDSPQQLRLLDGLRDEVVGAFFDRLDGDLDGSVTGNHDDFDFLIDGFGALQQLDAVHDRQAQIGDDDIDVLFFEQIEGLLPIVGLKHLVVRAFENLRSLRFGFPCRLRLRELLEVFEYS